MILLLMILCLLGFSNPVGRESKLFLQITNSALQISKRRGILFDDPAEISDEANVKSPITK